MFVFPQVAQTGATAPGFTGQVGGPNPSGAIQPLTFDASGNLNVKIAVAPTGAALDGTDTTGVTPPTGAVGIRGWLSGIYSKLSGTLNVSLGSLPTLPTGANTIGTVGLSSGTTVGITGTVPLPTGAATSANQATEITALQAIQASLAAPLSTSNVAASKATAGTLFGGSSVAVTMTGSALGIAALVNPSGSGKTLYVSFVSVGCGVSATYSRYRNATVTGGNLITPSNRGGGATAAVGKLYSAPTISGGTPEKIGYTSSNGQDNLAVDGSIILPQGSSLSWTMVNTASLVGLLTGAGTGSVEVVWWEV